MNDSTITPYAKIRGGLQGVALFTKPSTVRWVRPLDGESETYIIETCRQDEIGDTIFIEALSGDTVVKIALPPKAAAAIASQRESLTSRRRSAAGRARAQADKAAGRAPGFMRRAG